MSKKSDEATSRRGFLKLAATTTPIAAVAIATGETGEAEAAEPDLSSSRMQDTAHTRAYYASARF